MAFEIATPQRQIEQPFQRFNIRKVLIGRSYQFTLGTSFNSCSNIILQQIQASFLYKADRKTERTTRPEIRLNGCQERDIRIVGNN